MADRAVSAVLGYVLALGILTLVVSGLFLAAGNFVEGQQDRAIRAELEVVGNRLAADLAGVDRLALAAGSEAEAELLSDLPQRTAGQDYQLTIEEVTVSPNVYHLNLSTSNPDVTVRVRVRIQTTLVESTVNGGTVAIEYDGTEIEVADA